MVIAGEEDVAPALSDHWQDVTAAFHDEDAHQLYLGPTVIEDALRDRARIRLSSIDQDQPFQFRAQSADVAARGIREAEPELEKLHRSGYRTVVAFASRGEGERAAYNLGRLKVHWLSEDGAGDGRRDHVCAGPTRSWLHRAPVPPRGHPRPPAVPPPAAGAGAPGAPSRGAAQLRRPAHGRHRRPRGPRDRPLRRLRHQDGGQCHPRLPVPRIRRLGPRVRPRRPAGQDLPLRRSRRRPPAAVQARRNALGHDQGPGPAGGPGAGRGAAQPVCRAQAPRGPRFSRRHRLAARVRGRLPLHRDSRPARRDRVRQGRHGVAAADGPADLRGRRLRQDRGGAARGVQVGPGRQAGHAAGADDDPRPAALRHVHRAAARVPGDDRARLALPAGGRAARGGGSVQPRRGRHPHRDPSPAVA